MQSLLLDVNDLSALLRLSRTSIYTFLSDGRLPLRQHKFGRSVRFRRDEVEEYIKAGMPPAAEWRRQWGGTR